MCIINMIFTAEVAKVTICTYQLLAAYQSTHRFKIPNVSCPLESVRFGQTALSRLLTYSSNQSVLLDLPGRHGTDVPTTLMKYSKF